MRLAASFDSRPVLADSIASVPVLRLGVADVERWHARMRRGGVGETANRRRIRLDRQTVAEIEALRTEREGASTFLFSLEPGPPSPARIGRWWTRARRPSRPRQPGHDPGRRSQTPASARDWRGHDVGTWIDCQARGADGLTPTLARFARPGVRLEVGSCVPDRTL